MCIVTGCVIMFCLHCCVLCILTDIGFTFRFTMVYSETPDMSVWEPDPSSSHHHNQQSRSQPQVGGIDWVWSSLSLSPSFPLSSQEEEEEEVGPPWWQTEMGTTITILALFLCTILPLPLLLSSSTINGRILLLRTVTSHSLLPTPTHILPPITAKPLPTDIIHTLPTDTHGITHTLNRQAEKAGDDEGTIKGTFSPSLSLLSQPAHPLLKCSQPLLGPLDVINLL